MLVCAHEHIRLHGHGAGRQLAAHADEVPVGAVIVATDGTVLARTGNAMRRANDPTAHAGMLALREACATLGTDRLPDCDPM